MRAVALIVLALVASSGCRKVKIEVVGSELDGLDNPTDLAFNPEADELWVVNKDDDSVSIFDAIGTGDQTSTHIVDPYALHFMEKVTSIAFGAPGTFATCQDGRNSYNQPGPGNDFTGPTLWSSDRDIFGESNPEAVDYVTDLFGGPADLGSHLDMLHESPQCMGIAWEEGNAYWVFDGFNDDIVRYDFHEDHGAGYDDHCDGEIQRWQVGVTRIPDVVSHLAYDASSGLLYVADTGANRIAVLDTTVGSRGNSLPSVENGGCQATYGVPGPDHYLWEGGELVDLVTDLAYPAGLALFEGKLYVTENFSGRVKIFDLEGNELDVIDTELGEGALAGIEVVSEDEVWLVNGRDHELLRLEL
ncbi:MAG: hypothetical protein KC656_23565 [Myxococcales bacterium]|nr:hypothetical protein [Myxococcales bacterium]